MAARQSKPPFEFRIDPARPGDEEEISRLIHALAEYERAPQDCVATPSKVRTQLFGEKPVAYGFLARVGGRVVGMAIYYLSFSTWLSKPGLYLEDLFVLPEYRKHGIGGALLETLAKVCVEKDYGRMEWACLEWNELAKTQYRKVGAKPMEEWRTWRMTGDAIRALAERGDAKRPQPKEKPKAVAADGDVVVVYTDGGCRPNPGIRGWAAVLLHGDRTKELSGGEKESTNNRMELLAAINALEALKKPCRVEMHTDSQYVKNGISKWIHGWKKKNWMAKNNQPVKNDDLWKRLDKAAERHDVRWSWVRGHAGEKYNERCDELCALEIEKLDEKGAR